MLRDKNDPGLVVRPLALNNMTESKEGVIRDPADAREDIDFARARWVVSGDVIARPDLKALAGKNVGRAELERQAALPQPSHDILVKRSRTMGLSHEELPMLLGSVRAQCSTNAIPLAFVRRYGAATQRLHGFHVQ